MERKLTQDERECVEDLVESIHDADYGMARAAKQGRTAYEKMWKKIRELEPRAVSLKHPEDGAWAFKLCVREEKKE